jgi:hypothetical protein
LISIQLTDQLVLIIVLTVETAQQRAEDTPLLSDHVLPKIRPLPKLALKISRSCLLSGSLGQTKTIAAIALLIVL